MRSGVNSATTIRSPSTAILAIDSEDRFENYEVQRGNPTASSPYDFTIQKNQSLMNGFFTRIGLTEVVFPWVIPNISIGRDRIVANYGPAGGPYASSIVTIPTGFYTPAQVAAALQTSLRTATGNVLLTVTYGSIVTPTVTSIVPNFQVETNNGTDIFFNPIPNGPYPFGLIKPTTRQLFDMLGFSYVNAIPDTGQIGGATFCQLIKYIDIVCNQLTYNQDLKDAMSQTVNRDVICRLYLNNDATPMNVLPNSPTFCPVGCAPFTIYRDFATPKMIQWSPNQPINGSLRFEVFDDSGESLSIYPVGPYNGENWSMTLLVSEN